MTKFFLPWAGVRNGDTLGDKKLYLPKRSFPLEDACFHKNKEPYFSLPNPSGTVRLFLTALEKDHEEEALSYLSASVAALADLDEMKKLFGEKRELHFFSDEMTNDIRTVSLACGNGEGKTEVISLRMVAEPDHYGKWKIYCIEKE